MSSNLILVIATLLSLSVASILKRSTIIGSTSVYYAKNQYYVTDINVGSNKDKVSIMFDTGSFYPNVFTVTTTCPIACRPYATFDPSRSTTLIKTGKNITTYYGGSRSTSITGEVVYDDIEFGDITLKNITFLDDSYTQIWTVGILGVGPAIEEQWSPVINAYKQGFISKPMYSVYLADSSIGGGNFHMGGYDKAKLESDFKWFPYDPKSWQFMAQSDFMVINGQNITLNQTLAIDTGFNNGNLPEAAFNQAMSALGDAYDPSTGRISCSAIEGKTFTYSLNGVEMTLPLKSFVRPEQSGENCYRALNSGGTATIGAYFMRYMHFAFDYENKMIGIAQLKNTTETSLVSF